MDSGDQMSTTKIKQVRFQLEWENNIVNYVIFTSMQ